MVDKVIFGWNDPNLMDNLREKFKMTLYFDDLNFKSKEIIYCK